MSGDITLFLDFDGVLNNDLYILNQFNHVAPDKQRFFDPVNMEALCALIDGLNIRHLVITSTWRVDRSTEELRAILTQHGCAFDGKIETTAVLGLNYERRVAEIEEWIAEHSPKRVIILDDVDLALRDRRDFWKVPPFQGLTLPQVDKIIGTYKTAG